jgi:DNA replication protein DnaC
MMVQETIRKLNALKLSGMANAVESQIASSSYSNLSFEERLGLIVDAETTVREDRRLKGLLNRAKLRQNASIENIIYKPERGLDRSEIASLAQLNWIRSGINLIITGLTGTGKTWIACALGELACRRGFKTSFHRLSLLLEELAISHADGSFRKRLDQLAKVDLLVLDDFGISPLSAINRNDLLEVIESRSNSRSTIITSQLPVASWREYLADKNPTVAEAILDRVAGNANRLEMKGPTLRTKQHKNVSIK